MANNFGLFGDQLLIAHTTKRFRNSSHSTLIPSGHDGPPYNCDWI